MNVLTILNYLEQIEMKMMKIYEAFAGCAGDDREAAAFFRGMAREEAAHLEMVQFQLRVIVKDRKQYKDVEADLNEIIQLLVHGDKILIESDCYGLEGALQAAVFFEISAAESLYRTVLEKSNPELSVLVKNLQKFDHAHHDALVSFAEKRGLDVSISRGDD